MGDYLPLFDYNVNTLVAAFKAAGEARSLMMLHWDVLQFLLPAVCRQPGHRRDPRVSRRARGRARRHLRRSLAGADRRLRRDVVDPDAVVGRRSAFARVYWISLLFTFIGAAIFSFVRSRHARIPQEAIIGISYAVASAATILALSKSSSEGEHLKDMLVGNLLAVSWRDVWETAILYAIIGAFHFVFRKRFLAISMQPEATEASGVSLRLWDFLFYASFGFVVTRSVSLAGVLLVFCYLIVPSVAAMLYAEHRSPPGHRLDHGHDRIGTGRLAVAGPGSANRRHDRVHLRAGADPDGHGPAAVPAAPGHSDTPLMLTNPDTPPMHTDQHRLHLCASVCICGL